MSDYTDSLQWPMYVFFKSKKYKLKKQFIRDYYGKIQESQNKNGPWEDAEEVVKEAGR